MRERASSVFKSTLCANWVTMLGCKFQSVVASYVWKDTKSRRADVRIGAQGCGEAVDVGVGSFLGGFVVAIGRHFRCHLVRTMVPAEG